MMLGDGSDRARLIDKLRLEVSTGDGARGERSETPNLRLTNLGKSNRPHLVSVVLETPTTGVIIKYGDRTDKAIFFLSL